MENEKTMENEGLDIASLEIYQYREKIDELQKRYMSGEFGEIDFDEIDSTEDLVDIVHQNINGGREKYERDFAILDDAAEMLITAYPHFECYWTNSNSGNREPGYSVFERLIGDIDWIMEQIGYEDSSNYDDDYDGLYEAVLDYNNREMNGGDYDLIYDYKEDYVYAQCAMDGVDSDSVYLDLGEEFFFSFAAVASQVDDLREEYKIGEFDDDEDEEYEDE